MAICRRALHFVLKVGNLKQNLQFFRDKLGMTVLRHEVFEQGCDAACNGPYDGKWSKTMIGYGPEDDHFVLELTYNYTIGNYKLGNDLQHIKIGVKQELYDLVKTDDIITEGEKTCSKLLSPDGYVFLIHKLVDGKMKQDVTEVCLASSDLSASIRYWSDLLEMSQRSYVVDQEVLLNYSDDQASLKLRKLADKIDRKTAYGRIAFSCPSDQLRDIQERSENAKQTVLTPYISLDTPGKATVQVVILADCDGHEICFVGDEGFKQLSQFDPKAKDLIEKSIAEDKSDEWYQKKNKTKSEA